MFHYCIEVDFDDIPKDADISPLAPLVSRESHKNRGKIYDFHYRMESMPESINSLLEKYNGVSIGHDRTGTTTLFLNTKENLTKRKLEGLLETVGIISLKKTKIRDTKQSYSSC